jgi:hypothetical protein
LGFRLAAEAGVPEKGFGCLGGEPLVKLDLGADDPARTGVGEGVVSRASTLGRRRRGKWSRDLRSRAFTTSLSQVLPQETRTRLPLRTFCNSSEGPYPTLQFG